MKNSFDQKFEEYMDKYLPVFTKVLIAIAVVYIGGRVLVFFLK